MKNLQIFALLLLTSFFMFSSCEKEELYLHPIDEPGRDEEKTYDPANVTSDYYDKLPHPLDNDFEDVTQGIVRPDFEAFVEKHEELRRKEVKKEQPVVYRKDRPLLEQHGLNEIETDAPGGKMTHIDWGLNIREANCSRGGTTLQVYLDLTNGESILIDPEVFHIEWFNSRYELMGRSDIVHCLDTGWYLTIVWNKRTLRTETMQYFVKRNITNKEKQGIDFSAR